MGEERSKHKVLVGRPEETIQKGHGMILKRNCAFGMNLFDPAWGQVAGYCEHGPELWVP